MSLRKDVSEIKDNLKKLNSFLVSDTEKKAKKYDKMKEYLSYYKIKIKHIVETEGPTGKPAIKIVYENPQIILEFDEEGNPIENEVFKAINGLDLVNTDDSLTLINSIGAKKMKILKDRD